MRTAMRVVMLAAAVLGLAGCAAGGDVFGKPEAGYVADAKARTAAADWAKAETVTVELSEFAFTPSTLTFRAGKPYRLIIRNVGRRDHTFASEGFFRTVAVDKLRSSEGEVANPYLKRIAISAGAAKELFLVAVEPGVYALSCTVFLHDTFGMTGTITTH